jgi:hypothetical protein
MIAGNDTTALASLASANETLSAKAGHEAKAGNDTAAGIDKSPNPAYFKRQNADY